MKPVATARTTPAPYARMSHDPDPGYFPPPPTQPLPPGKQPTGPMPDQERPPIGPHHLPDDPVAVPDEGEQLRWTPAALASAALRARIGLRVE